MSYCRMNKESDAYVWGGKHYLNCHDPENFNTFYTGNYTEMIKHLEVLREHGFLIPQSAINKLNEERSEFGEIYKWDN